VLKEQKKEELGEDEPEFLKEQLTKAGELSEVRDLKIIQQERDRILEDKSSLKSKVDEMKTAIHKWEKEYSDKNGLFGKRAEFTSKMTELYKELSQNEELPEDFETLESFNQYVDQLFAEIEELREQKQQLEIEVAEKEGKAPDISSEEQKSIMEEAKAEFDKVHTKAESLARVKDRTDALLADLEQQTYTPLTEGIIKWLGIMSDGRFNNITLDEEGKEIPSTFVTSDDQEIPFHLLSHGTKDLTALAWKLTVTEKFLKDQSSLILLDDPMVDMDPERKKMAGKALIEFAEQQQVILFSCHPEMEEILNNNLNTLEI
jgi:exonuclease SbcC